MPPAPNPVTPLDWKMYEAIGEPLPTEGLPIAFSYAELGPRAGWKAQIEAAERLTRAGTIPPNVILGLYTEREPAASGGVWDRVEAFQDFEAALAARRCRTGRRDPAGGLGEDAGGRAGGALCHAVRQGPAGHAPDRASLRPSRSASGCCRPMPRPSRSGTSPPAPRMPSWWRWPRARPRMCCRPTVWAAPSRRRSARPTPSAEAQALLDGNRTGEAILVAIDNIGRGVQGDLRGVTEGLSLLAHGRAGGRGAAHRAGTDDPGTAGLTMPHDRGPRRAAGSPPFWTRGCRRPGAARNTQLAYGRDLVDFADWLERRGLAPGHGGPGGGRGLPGLLRCAGPVQGHAGAAAVVDPAALPLCP